MEKPTLKVDPALVEEHARKSVGVLGPPVTVEKTTQRISRHTLEGLLAHENVPPLKRRRSVLVGSFVLVLVGGTIAVAHPMPSKSVPTLPLPPKVVSNPPQALQEPPHASIADNTTSEVVPAPPTPQKARTRPKAWISSAKKERAWFHDMPKSGL